MSVLYLLCSLAVCAAANRVVPRGIDPNFLPQNTAVEVGQNVVFRCWKDPFSAMSPRIQWHEFATLPQGQLISDDIFVLPSHPNSARYRIVVDEDAVNQRDLHVLNVTLADAGTYACVDGVASIVEVRRATAELVVIGELSWVAIHLRTRRHR